jgi:hypothetical protein
MSLPIHFVSAEMNRYGEGRKAKEKEIMER